MGSSYYKHSIWLWYFNWTRLEALRLQCELRFKVPFMFWTVKYQIFSWVSLYWHHFLIAFLYWHHFLIALRDLKCKILCFFIFEEFTKNTEKISVTYWSLNAEREKCLRKNMYTFQSQIFYRNVRHVFLHKSTENKEGKVKCNFWSSIVFKLIH